MTRHRQFTVDGKPFLSLGGQSRNSSSFTPEDAEYACRSVAALGGNTVAFPVSWEVFEPEEGVFDRDFVRGLIDRVRTWDLHLTILWFATWKNGTMEYCPPWVKVDQERFPRTQYPNGEPSFVLSCHCARNRDADATAFRALMETIRDHDATVGTVIGVQVENETGIYAPVRRDFGPDGAHDFGTQVPKELIEYARARPATRLNRWWASCGGATAGTWPEVFGSFAAEACTTWYLARYVNEVAARGKEVYDIPLTVNTWADDGFWRVGGLDYPCGGPIHTTPALDIWKAAASEIDFICPDVYVPDLDTYRSTVDAYSHPEDGWPLFVPESLNSNPNPTLMFYAIVEKGGVGQHVFAVEELVDPEGRPCPVAMPFVRSFRMLLDAAPLIHRYRGSTAMHALYQTPSQRLAHVPVRGWMCTAAFGGPDFRWNGTDFRHLEGLTEEFEEKSDLRQELGRGLVVQAGDDEFYLVGHHVRVFFQPTLPDDGSVPYSLVNPVHQAASMPTLAIQEGHFEGDGFVVDRPRTGDEARHGIWLAADCGVVRVVLSAQG